MPCNQNCSRQIFFSFFFFFYFSEKTSVDILCELSAWQMIYMKCQDLFSLKNNKKNFFSMLSAKILLGTLRVNELWHHTVERQLYMRQYYFKVITWDMRWYIHNIFLISPQKHVMVLIRSASARRF